MTGCFKLSYVEEDLKRISDFTGAVDECGKALSSTLMIMSPPSPVVVGQRVLAKSVLHNGEWRNAVVMSVSPW
jgi:hypothetical protein